MKSQHRLSYAAANADRLAIAFAPAHELVPAHALVLAPALEFERMRGLLQTAVETRDREQIGESDVVTANERGAVVLGCY